MKPGKNHIGLILSILTWGYLVILLLMAAFPFNTATLHEIDKSYIGSFRGDHILHFLLFLPFFPLVCLQFGCTHPSRLTKVIPAGLGTGLFCELIQYFLPYRAFTLADLSANAIGVLLSLIVFLLLRSQLNKLRCGMISEG